MHAYSSLQWQGAVTLMYTVHTFPQTSHVISKFQVMNVQNPKQKLTHISVTIL